MKISTWMKRAVVWLTCAMPVLLPIAAQAESKPVAVVSFAGYDALMTDLNYLGELSGTPGLGQSLEGILALVTRAQGLAGLDKGKPIGAAVSLSEQGEPTPLVFIPVTDASKLLDALQGLVPDVEDLGEGFSKLRLPNGPPVIMKEANGWAYLSTTKENLAAVPKDPSKMLGDLPEDYDLAVQVNVRNIPPQFIQLAVDQMKRGAEVGLRQKPDEDEATYQLRKEITEKYLNQFATVIQEIDKFTIGFEIDEEDGGAYLDTEVTMQAGGKLAAQFDAAKKGAKKSILAGFADEEAVANFHFVSPVMEDDAKMILDAIKMGREQAAKKIAEDDKLSDATIKEAVQGMVSDLFDVAVATIKGGRVNGGAVIYGEGPFEIYAGGLVVDAKKVEKVVKQAIKLFGSAPGFPEVKLDAGESGGVTYHTIVAPVTDSEAKKIFGEEVTIALGFGENVIVIGVAEEDVIKSTGEILADKEGADELPPAQLQVKLGPIMQFAVNNDEDVKEPAKMLAKLLADSDEDHITVVTDYITNGQRTSLEVDEGLLKAIGKAIVAGMQRGGR